MDARQVQENKVRCARRVLARKRPATERVYPRQGFGGADLIADVVQGSTTLPPAGVSEWLDDRLATLPWCGPHAGVLHSIGEAARHSQAAAVAAVGTARRLAPWDQWHAYVMLTAWDDLAAIPAARALMRELHREWERCRLAAGRPGEPELGDLPDPPKAPRIRYATRWGNPAGLPWADTAVTFPAVAS